MLCSGAIYEAIENGSGFFQHGHTYLGHPAATAAGLAVITAMERRNLMPRVREQGGKLDAALRETFGQHPHVGDIRGRGLFQGIEIVEDRSTKTPFDPARKIAPKIKAAAFEAGLICYPMQGTRDGAVGDHVLLAPPFIISDEEIGVLCERLSTAVEAALA